MNRNSLLAVAFLFGAQVADGALRLQGPNLKAQRLNANRPLVPNALQTGLSETRAQSALPRADAAQLKAWGLDVTSLDPGEVGLRSFQDTFEVTSADVDGDLLFAAPDQGRTVTLDFYLHPRGLNLSLAIAKVATQDGVDWLAPQLSLGARGIEAIALKPNEWNHVSFASDLNLTETVRLIVNESARVVVTRELEVSTIEPDLSYAVRAGLALSQPFALQSEQSFWLAEVRLAERYVSTQELLEPMTSEPTLEVRLAAASAEPTFEWQAAERERVVLTSTGLEWVPGDWSRDRPSIVDADGQPNAQLSPPLPRTCHAVAALGDGRVLMYGGELRDSHFGRMANGGDTWIYDMRKQTWRQVLGPGPPPRCHIGIATTPDGSLTFLQGGWFNLGSIEGSTTYGDTWLFDSVTEKWTQCPPSEPECLLSDVQPIYEVNRERFIFSGVNSLWYLDPKDPVLKFMPGLPIYEEADPNYFFGTTGEAMTWFDSRYNLMVRWGGYLLDDAGEKSLDDKTFLYSSTRDLGVRRQARPPVPQARTRGALAYDSKQERAILFGGILGGLNERANDLWTYDVATNQWTELRAANAPSERGGYFGMAYDASLDAFLLPYGRHDESTFPDEVWRLTLRPEAMGTALWRFNVLEWEPRLPQATWQGDLTGTIEWRTSSDGASWSAWQMSGAVGGASQAWVEVRASVPPGAQITALDWVIAQGE